MKKRIFSGLLLAVVSLSSVAQVSTTLSPYSQFGLGVLADQSQGFNRGMNGRLNSKTANFDYAVAAFRLLPKVGFSFGVMPYSNVGYDFYSAKYTNWDRQYASESYYNVRYNGDGGFSQVFVGMGWEVLKGLSVGANVSYFWGKYTKDIMIYSSDTYVNTQTKTYSTSISSYKLDFGLQYQQALDKKNLLTVGATVGLGHNLGGQASMSMVSTNNQTSVSQTTRDSIPDAFKLPLTLGIGASVRHNNRLTVGADYTFQKWGSIDYPMQTSNVTADHKLGYQLVGNQLRDRHKVTVGADWIPNPTGRKFLGHVHYRFGASYATPYYNVGDVKGPRELSISAGFGIPLVNTWNNRSTLNISAQWVNRSADNLIRENSFRLNIGLTFNERWFAKWKVD